MKKPVRKLTVAEAVKQARADLRLENTAVPEWGRHVFARIESLSSGLSARLTASCRWAGWMSISRVSHSGTVASGKNPRVPPRRRSERWLSASFESMM